MRSWSPFWACCCSVAKLCLILCVLMAPLSSTVSRNLLKLMSIQSVMSSNHLILCRPLLFLPSIFPSIRVFSNESVLRIRWPKSIYVYCNGSMLYIEKFKLYRKEYKLKRFIMKNVFFDAYGIILFGNLTCFTFILRPFPGQHIQNSCSFNFLTLTF